MFKIKNNEKKTSKYSKLQKGGTLFEINYKQLDELVDFGWRGCSTCAMNQLGFPEDLVNSVSDAVNKRKSGFRFIDALNIIYTLQKREYGGLKSKPSIYVWALSKSGEQLLKV